jgi:hypothetical protein
MPNPAYDAGTYSILAADNLPVSEAEWRAYGGSIEVRINTEIPGAIDVLLTGPNREIPGVSGPFSLAVSDGETTYPVFSVVGAGVFTSPETVNIRTGASPEKTTEEVAQKVDNFMHSSVEMIYSRVVWTTERASGPMISLTATIPTTAAEGFGLVAGSLVSWKESIYRVTNATIDGEWVTITATRHVTVADFDVLMAADSITVGDFDTFWAGNVCEDVKIKPLRSVA